MRPEAHKTDTIARRLVPQAFPALWEHRELTGRDYGIDMILEIFENGIPNGCFLSLQIKGTTHIIEEDVNEIKFDIPVNTLRYSELFVSPVLLVICPINDPDKRVFYLWLQEYINVVLNYENPNWKENLTTVRVGVPVKNIVSEDIDKLAWIANNPKRNYEFVQLARIHAKLIHAVREYCEWDGLDVEEYSNPEEMLSKIQYETRALLENIIQLINELEDLKSIFGDEKWKSPQTMLKETIQPAKEGVLRLLEGNTTQHKKDKLKLFCLDSISALLELCNDNSYSHFLWKLDGSHDF
jgi:hypothetical protein